MCSRQKTQQPIMLSANHQNLKTISVFFFFLPFSFLVCNCEIKLHFIFNSFLYFCVPFKLPQRIDCTSQIEQYSIYRYIYCMFGNYFNFDSLSSLFCSTRTRIVYKQFVYEKAFVYPIIINIIIIMDYYLFVCLCRLAHQHIYCMFCLCCSSAHNFIFYLLLFLYLRWRRLCYLVSTSHSNAFNSNSNNKMNAT